jgi:drug/metabolite transporter (DMT)-like permease
LIAGSSVEAIAGSGRLPPRPGRLYSLVGLMTFFWSANFLIGKIALREFPGPLAAALRILFAALASVPLCRWKTGNWGRWQKRDGFILASLGAVGIGVNQFCFLVGLSKTSIAHSALIIGTTPISVLLIAAARGMERITGLRLLGMLAALGGVALLGREHGAAAAGGAIPTLAGDLITFLASAAFAAYIVFSKEVRRRYAALPANAWLFGSAGVCVLPMALWQGWRFPFSHVSAAGWLAILYMAAFPSLFCYLVFYWALDYFAASRLSAFSYLQPVLATLLGVLLLGERISAPLLAGGAVILGGVFLTERG